MRIEILSRRIGKGVNEGKGNEKVKNIRDFFGVVSAGVVDYGCSISVRVFNKGVSVSLPIISANALVE